MAPLSLYPYKQAMAISFYLQQLQQLQATEKKLNNRQRLFAWLRLAIVLAIIAVIYCWASQWKIWLLPVVALLILLRWVIYKDVGNKQTLQHNRSMQAINHAEIKALQTEDYSHFADGNQHNLPQHAYAADLDIFGPGSLFQFVNRTVSDIGSAQLASWLLNPATKKAIEERQAAITELQQQIPWVQQLQAHGSNSPVSLHTQAQLQHWMQEPPLFAPSYYSIIRWLLPAISISITIATIAGWVGLPVFYANLLFMFVIAGVIERKVKPLHAHLGKITDQLQTLGNSITHIEKQNFTSPLLRHLQQAYHHEQNNASVSIGHLKKILDALDIRYNIVLALPLNLLLLWNLQQCLRLEKWKQQYSRDITQWFSHLGILEALGSLAVLRFNQPHWCLPGVQEDGYQVQATRLGHPLIPASKSVTNTIDISRQPTILLITGSNMAGKSTYLRSVGVNIVLAMAGAPVCAQSFSVPVVQLISSMRIADNLQESTSTFYAELKKLKQVIDRVNQKEKLFILLDEILRGTNSLDRNTGSRALIKQLIHKEAVALIATHDLDLAALENEYPRALQNFHFDVQVSGEELYFDYRLKPGICQSMNASVLMKKIGIEI